MWDIIFGDLVNICSLWSISKFHHRDGVFHHGLLFIVYLSLQLVGLEGFRC